MGRPALLLFGLKNTASSTFTRNAHAKNISSEGPLSTEHLQNLHALTKAFPNLSHPDRRGISQGLEYVSEHHQLYNSLSYKTEWLSILIQNTLSKYSLCSGAQSPRSSHPHSFLRFLWHNKIIISPFITKRFRQEHSFSLAMTEVHPSLWLAQFTRKQSLNIFWR